MNKRETWEWIKKNDPALKKFLLDAPKGFIANVTLETPSQTAREGDMGVYSDKHRVG